MAENDLVDAYFTPFTATVETEIHAAANRVRHEMNGALMAIDTRSDTLSDLTTATAVRIGKVEVDYGEIGCETPNTVPYIAKARAHRRKKRP